jgi:hypothetical protein
LNRRWTVGLNRILSIIIALIGVVGIIAGAVFVFEGFSKNDLIVSRMATENVTLAADPANPKQLIQIRNADDAQKAGDLISTHRRSIAPNYQALLGAGQFDATNPKDLTYAQAMNLENYLYTAVLAFGLVQVVLGAGAFMIITGIGLGATGLLLYRTSK